MPRVLVLTPEGYTFGQNTLLTDLIAQAGGINAAAEAGYADYRQIDDQTILSLAPDVVLLTPAWLPPVPRPSPPCPTTPFCPPCAPGACCSCPFHPPHPLIRRRRADPGADAAPGGISPRDLPHPRPSTKVLRDYRNLFAPVQSVYTDNRH